jgi:hypothetical protein
MGNENYESTIGSLKGFYLDYPSKGIDTTQESLIVHFQMMVRDTYSPSRRLNLTHGVIKNATSI